MNEIDNISGVLNLRCPNHHDLGRLLKQRHGGTITYGNRPWTLMMDQGFFSFPVCPGGCQYEVVGLPEDLEAKLTELANDSEAEQDTYTLKFLGPPRETSDSAIT